MTNTFGGEEQIRAMNANEVRGVHLEVESFPTRSFPICSCKSEAGVGRASSCIIASFFPNEHQSDI